MYDPERYEKNKSAPARDIAEFVPKLIRNMSWKYNETIVDYGCGAGSVAYNFLLPEALCRGSTIDAVDISAEMVDYARLNYAHAAIRYHCGNIVVNEFPLKGKQYDRIFFIYVLHFMKDYRTTLKKLLELLKPGGELGMMVLDKARVFTFLDKIGQNSKWRDYMPSYRDFLPVWYEEKKNADTLLQEAMEEVGYKLVDLTTEERSYVFQPEVMIDIFMSLNPYLKQLPVEEIPALREDYAKLTRPFVGDCGNVYEDYTMVYCHACRKMEI